MSGSFEDWVVCRKRQPAARARLFCFPHAGGGTAFFRAWAERLGPEIEVCAVLLPGRESRLREAPVSDLRTLADRFAEAVGSVLGDLPFAAFGHSMGAWLGFEWIRSVRRRGGPEPCCLIASGRKGPRCPSRYSPIAELPDARFVDELVRRYDAIPAEVLGDADLMAMFLPVLRADFRSLETYAYRSEEILDCPIRAFGGEEDERSRPDELDRWAQETSADFSRRIFPGGHFYCADGNVAVLDAVREAILDRTDAARSN